MTATLTKLTSGHRALGKTCEVEGCAGYALLGVDVRWWCAEHHEQAREAWTAAMQAAVNDRASPR